MTTKKKTNKPTAQHKIKAAIPDLPRYDHTFVPFGVTRDTTVAIESPAGNYIRATAGDIYDRLKPPFGTIEEGVNILANALKQDNELFDVYRANIAMAFVDAMQIRIQAR